MLFLFYYAPINIAISSSTFDIVPIPNVSTNTFATFGERNAGSVGPKWMFFSPMCN